MCELVVPASKDNIPSKQLPIFFCFLIIVASVAVFLCVCGVCVAECVCLCVCLCLVVCNCVGLHVFVDVFVCD